MRCPQTRRQNPRGWFLAVLPATCKVDDLSARQAGKTLFPMANYVFAGCIEVHDKTPLLNLPVSNPC